jgi:predicted small lipoprotein YifL
MLPRSRSRSRPRSRSRSRSRSRCDAIVAIALAAALAACGTSAPVAVPEPLGAPEQPEAETTAAEEGLAASDPIVDERSAAGLDARLTGPATLEVLGADGTVSHGWTLHDGETFHAILVRPAATADGLDVVAVVLQGERPVLHHASVRAGSATLAAFPDHLQPAHVVDAAPPAIAWTPDALSLVWTETTGEDLVLRTVGWDDGPGTGRDADDNASFVLELPPDARVDVFEVGDDGTWTLLLRDGTAEPHEVRIGRQTDGALALPPA